MVGISLITSSGQGVPLASVEAQVGHTAAMAASTYVHPVYTINLGNVMDGAFWGPASDEDQGRPTAAENSR